MELFKLYFPLLFILVPIFFAFKIKRGTKVEYKIPITIGGVIEYSFTVKSKQLYNMILAISFLPSLFFYAFYDYSSFFPKDLSLEIFYDKPGILTNMKLYSKIDLQVLNIDTNFSLRDSFYFKSLDKEINALTTTKCFFLTKNGVIHSQGKTTFIVEKINGFQRYRIIESKGEVLHQLDEPEAAPKIIKSYFEKMDNQNDFIELSFFDILKGNIIIKPLFKQTIAEKNLSDGAHFNHLLCGLTTINVFPLPKYSNTLYLLQYENKLIPIGYAIYK